MPALTPARTVAGASTLASVSSAIAAAHCASKGASVVAASRMAIRMGSSLLDDPAGHAGTGIAGRLADVVIRRRVHDHRTVQRIVGSAAAQHRTVGMHI